MSGATLEQVKDVFTEINAANQILISNLKKEFEDKEKIHEEKIKLLETEILNTRKTVTSGDMKDNSIDADGKWGFKDFGVDFARAVYKAALNPLHIDERLLKIRQKAAGEGLEEGTDSEGGFLIPPEFRAALLSAGIEKSEFIKRCMEIPMQRNSIRIPYIKDTDRSSGYVHGAVLLYWTQEEGSGTKSQPTFGRVELTLKKLIGLTYGTEEILQDSPISIAPMLDMMYSDAFSWVLDDMIIAGVGGSQPLGVTNAPCTIEVSAESSQIASTIVWQNIIKMYARSTASAKRNGIFIANHNTLPQLTQMSIAVGTGGSGIFIPAGGASAAPYNTLLGRPIIFTEHCQSVGTSGDIMFCDFGQYLIGMKTGTNKGMKTDVSTHFKFDTDETAFKFTFRIDGQPWLPAAITPHRGDSISPFVKLATRS